MTPLEELQLRITIIKDIITAGSAFVVAVIGILGLQAWKEQLRGKTEYELAQRLLNAVYRVREALENIRLFPIGGSEEAKAIEAANVDVELEYSKKVAAARAAIYSVRWPKVQEALIQLNTLSLEGEAHWGQDMHKNLTPLLECAAILKTAMERYVAGLKDPLHYDVDERAMDEHILFSSSQGVKNIFSEKMAAAINRIEQFLKPHLKI